MHATTNDISLYVYVGGILRIMTGGKTGTTYGHGFWDQWVSSVRAVVEDTSVTHSAWCFLAVTYNTFIHTYP